MLATQLRDNKYTLIATALLLPAVLFELIGISKFTLPGNPVYEWFAVTIGNPQTNPIARALEIVVVFGPVLALLLTLVPTVHIKLTTEQASLISTITIKGNLWNIAVITMSLIVLGILGTYVIVENWQCIIGLRTSC